MKKLILTVALAFFALYVSQAQNAATPNPSFNNWTQVANYFNPNSWNNLNGQTAILGVFTCTRVSAAADVHSGAYAMKLTTKSVFGITANGIASTATLITTPPYGVTGGIPYTERPDSIVGWFKCTPANTNDSGFVQFVLLGSTNDTIGFVKFNMPNTPVGTYTRFSRPVIYSSAATPVTSYWIISASDGVNPVVNSSIIIDDIDLIFNPSGVGEAENHFANQVQLISNMATDFVNVSNKSEKIVQLTIFDNSGKEVKSELIPKGNVEVDVQQLNSGIYFYRLSQTGNDNGRAHGKFIKM